MAMWSVSGSPPSFRDSHYQYGVTFMIVNFTITITIIIILKDPNLGEGGGGFQLLQFASLAYIAS